jgi:nucleoside-diphosphate-sugar epimerase
MRILITGGNGFIGSALAREFFLRGHEVSISVRRIENAANVCNDQVFINDLGPSTNWREALDGQEVVVHTSARVHVMHETSQNPIDEFRKVNVEGTLNLARQAAEAGVHRFIFLSSIKVNGESTLLGKPFTADDVPNPQTAYGISKYEAEKGLFEISEKRGLNIVVIRLPLVYGPRVRGNFLGLIHWLAFGLPIPLGAVRNARSMVGIGNLVSFIGTCLANPAASNRILLVSDGEDISTSALLKRLAKALGKRPNLIPVPVFVLDFVLRLLGKKDFFTRLCGSLQADISASRSLLGWRPLFSVDEELQKTAKEMRSTNSTSHESPIDSEDSPARGK